MQALMITVIIKLIKWYVGTGVFDRIEALVLEMTDTTLTNDDKRHYVVFTIKKEFTMIKTRIIDMVIGTILTKLSS